MYFGTVLRNNIIYRNNYQYIYFYKLSPFEQPLNYRKLSEVIVMSYLTPNLVHVNGYTRKRNGFLEYVCEHDRSFPNSGK